jgi:hypothetical protein
MRQINRIQPAAPVEAYQTYQVLSPRDTLIRAACEQVGCLQWRHGWETPVDEGTDLGQAQAAYIRQRSGRTFTERRTGEGLTVFRFESGQRCFADHSTRPESYLVRAGDWRQHLGVIRRHVWPADFVEDMGEQLQTIADQQQKG